MGDDRQHISIGKFAGLTGISANTLRRYDELGLLSPAVTDPSSGYRLYDIGQLDTGVLIRLLRDLDVPLGEVRALLRPGGAGGLQDLLAQHRERILDRLAELERIVTRIDAALNEDRGLLPYEIDLVTLPDVWVVSCRRRSARQDLDAAIEECLRQLATELAGDGAEPLGRELVLYHNALHWYQGLDMEVCLPVDVRVAAAHGGRRLPACTAMQTIYRGLWDDIWQAYAAMLARLSRKGYEVCGPVRESYLVDERDTDDTQRYMTLLTWPVQPRPDRPA